MMKKTFSVHKNKVVITESAVGFEFTIESPLGKYHFKGMKDIHELKSELHEAADNNDIGRVLAEKAHDWYYSTHDVEEERW